MVARPPVRRLPARVVLYVALLAGAAAAVLLGVVAAAPDFPPAEIAVAAILAAVFALESLFDHRLARGHDDGETPGNEETYLVLLLLLVSPALALLAILAAELASNLMMRRPFVKLAFNTGAFLLPAALTLAVAEALGGADTSGAGLAVAGAATLVFVVVNQVLVAGVIALLGLRRFWANLFENVRTAGVVTAANIALGLLAAVAVADDRRLLVLVVPVVFALHRALAARVEAQVEREKLHEIVEGTSDGIFSVDESGAIVSWNGAMAGIHGTPAAGALGRPAADVLRPGEPNGFFVAELRAAAGDEVTVRHADGTPRLLRVSSAPLASGGSVFVAADMTERRELESRVRQAHKMEAVGRVAGGIARDFHDTLQVIRARLHAALEGVEPGPRADGLREAADAAGLAHGLAQELLAFASPGALRLEPLDLAEFVRGLDGVVRHLAGRKVAVEIDAEAPVWVVADRNRLTQLLVNLATNAVDAMPDGGELRVAVGNGLSRTAVLAVADTGVGMAPDVRERLFEPFFTTKEDDERPGLGLASVYAIAVQLGGAVDVESIPGAGSRFTVTLPLSAAPAELAVA
jgi:PAS domain S-box-containing protein